MKINVEVDITPEEMRRFLGLPDVQEWQQSMIDTVAENLSNSHEQQQEFVKNMLAGSIAPWQNLFGIMANASAPNNTGKKAD